MEQNKAGAREIVEVTDGKVKVTQDKECVPDILELTKTYEFEGEKISSLDLSGLKDLTAETMIRAGNIMAQAGTAAVVPENNLHYALIIAADATGMPIEFFKKLNLRDAIQVKTRVTRVFYGLESN